MKMNEEKDMELHGADSETVSEQAETCDPTLDVLCDEVDGSFHDSDDVIQMEGCEDNIAADANDKIFGVSRRTFRLIIIGYALGVIAAGLLGLVGLYNSNSTIIPGAIGAIICYFIGIYLDRREENNANDSHSKQ